MKESGARPASVAILFFFVFIIFIYYCLVLSADSLLLPFPMHSLKIANKNERRRNRADHG